jgi:hypothetical protein
MHAKGMVLANNVLYSRDENALHFANGKDGVVIAGNVIVGHGPKEGTSPGRGLEDFVESGRGMPRSTTPGRLRLRHLTKPMRDISSRPISHIAPARLP